MPLIQKWITKKVVFLEGSWIPTVEREREREGRLLNVIDISQEQINKSMQKIIYWVDMVE